MPMMPHGHPYKSRTGPRPDLKGQPWASRVAGCTLDAHGCPFKSRQGPCGICTGDHGASQACPYGPRTGFRRGLMGKVHLTLLWANRGQSRYGARTVFKRGCPRPDWPWCASGAPYQSHVGSDRDRYPGSEMAALSVWLKVLFLWTIVQVESRKV